jgi:hypothetical protein
MKRFVTLFIAALLFIMPTFSETWVYKDWENQNGYLHNIYAYDTEEDFINSREADVQKETGASKSTAHSLFYYGPFVKVTNENTDVQYIKNILRKGNYAYVMITWYESIKTHAQVFKLVNNTLYGADYSTIF